MNDGVKRGSMCEVEGQAERGCDGVKGEGIASPLTEHSWEEELGFRALHPFV